MKFGLFGGARAKRGGAPATATPITTSSTTWSRPRSSAFERLPRRAPFHRLWPGLGVDEPARLSAARTERIRLGTAVVVLPWHNPVLVAEQAATLDLLSNGRLDFGVGKGYRAYEFSGFCIPQEEATERFDEAMEVIRKAWTSQGRFSHHGKRWHFDNVVVEPSPIQQPHPPFWLGAGSAEFDPPRGARGLQSAARPDRADRSDHRPRRDFPRGMRAGRPALRPDDGRRHPRAADRAQRGGAPGASTPAPAVLKNIGDLARGGGSDRTARARLDARPARHAGGDHRAAEPLEAGGVENVLFAAPAPPSLAAHLRVRDHAGLRLTSAGGATRSANHGFFRR